MLTKDQVTRRHVKVAYITVGAARISGEIAAGIQKGKQLGLTFTEVQESLLRVLEIEKERLIREFEEAKEAGMSDESCGAEECECGEYNKLAAKNEPSKEGTDFVLRILKQKQEVANDPMLQMLLSAKGFNVTDEDELDRAVKETEQPSPKPKVTGPRSRSSIEPFIEPEGLPEAFGAL